jgi:hypothetical protein
LLYLRFVLDIEKSVGVESKVITISPVVPVIGESIFFAKIEPFLEIILLFMVSIFFNFENNFLLLYIKSKN